MNYYNEFDPEKAAWLEALIEDGLIPPGDIDTRSIADVRPHEIVGYTQQHFFAGIGGWSLALRIAGWPDSRRVRTASCPCQPFSNSGRRLGIEDPRHLFPFLRDHIAFGEPTVTFGEQVASEAGRDWLSHVRADLEGLGHEVGAADLCAAGAGADHIRPRLWWVANPCGERQQKSRQHWTDAIRQQAPGFGEADRLVDALRRDALPFLCRGHDGVPARVGQVAIKGFGDAIVPQLAAEFIRAFLEC